MAPWELIVWAAAVGVSVLLVGIPIFLLFSGYDAARTRHRVLERKELRESANPPRP